MKAEASASASGKVGLSSDKEKEIVKEISSAAESNQELVYEIECQPLKGEKRTGLWQWVIATQDYSYAAFTPHTVCRSGKYAFMPPACPFWNCANYDCTECKSKNESTDESMDELMDFEREIKELDDDLAEATKNLKNALANKGD